MPASAHNQRVRLLETLQPLADFFGAVATNDPAFLASSVSPQLADTRNVSFDRVMREEWLDAEQPVSDGSYNPYPPGACFANLMWRAREGVGEAQTVAAWVAAQQVIAERVQTDLQAISFAFLVNTVVNAFTPAESSAPRMIL